MPRRIKQITVRYVPVSREKSDLFRKTAVQLQAQSILRTRRKDSPKPEQNTCE